MTTTNTDRPKVTIVSFEVFPDGSGAEAVIRSGRHAFAINCLGEIKVTPLNRGYIHGEKARRVLAWHMQKALAVYERLLAELDPAWRAANRDMYLAE